LNLYLLKAKKINILINSLIIMLFIYPTLAFGKDLEISAISIVTPQWDGQTNKDGTGLFFEIARNIYESEGIKITYDFFPWKRSKRMVSFTEADAMFCMWKKEAADEKLLIPKYPMSIEYTGVLFKKERIRNWEGIMGLGGKRAVWLRGYDYHTTSYLKDIKFSKWTEVDEYYHAWDFIIKELYDFYIDALNDMDQYIRINKVDMSPYRLEILWSERGYMVFSDTEKSKKLIKIFDTEIIRLHNSGKLKEIYQKWHVRYPGEAWTD